LHWLALVLVSQALVSGDPGQRQAAAGVRKALTAFFEAGRQNSPAQLSATLAPDYRYDGLTAAQFANQFDGDFGIRYRSVFYRIESLSVAGGRATAIVTLQYQGNVNMEAFQLGRPAVNGTARMAIELEPRDGIWKVTAARVVRGAYAVPGEPAPFLVRLTVNGETSLVVPPGADLEVVWESFGGALFWHFIGESFVIERTNPSDFKRWSRTLKAPMTPGRYVVHALFFAPDVVTMTQATVPVTVRGSQLPPLLKECGL
jgi:hypothetical protein